MDKQHQTIVKNVKHQKGFALILTLSVLAVVIALTSVLLGYFTQVYQDATATKALIQGNLYYNDIKTILNKKKSRKSVYEDFLYLSSLPLGAPKTNFLLNLHCYPLANGVNINWLGLEENQKFAAQSSVAESLFLAIVEKYHLKDGNRLHTLLVEHMGKVGEKSIVLEEERLRERGAIGSFQVFQEILERYQLASDDANVLKVPWRELFVFYPMPSSPKENVIDARYLSSTFIQLLFDVDMDIINEYQEGNQLNFSQLIQEQTAETLNRKLYKEKFVAQTECEVSYKYAQNWFRFTFVDIQGEVKNFEFYAKQ